MRRFSGRFRLRDAPLPIGHMRSRSDRSYGARGKTLGPGGRPHSRRPFGTKLTLVVDRVVTLPDSPCHLPQPRERIGTLEHEPAALIDLSVQEVALFDAQPPTQSSGDGDLAALPDSDIHA